MGGEKKKSVLALIWNIVSNLNTNTNVIHDLYAPNDIKFQKCVFITLFAISEKIIIAKPTVQRLRWVERGCGKTTYMPHMPQMR